MNNELKRDIHKKDSRSQGRGFRSVKLQDTVKSVERRKALKIKEQKGRLQTENNPKTTEMVLANVGWVWD